MTRLKLRVPDIIEPTVSGTQFGRRWYIQARLRDTDGAALEENFDIRIAPGLAASKPAAESVSTSEAVAPEIAELLRGEREAVLAARTSASDWKAESAPPRREDPELVLLRSQPLPRRIAVAIRTCLYMAFGMTVGIGCIFSIFIKFVSFTEHDKPHRTFLEILVAALRLTVHFGLPFGIAGGLQRVFGGTTLRDGISGALGSALGIAAILAIYQYVPIVGNMSRSTAIASGLFFIAMGAFLGIGQGMKEGEPNETAEDIHRRARKIRERLRR